MRSIILSFSLAIVAASTTTALPLNLSNPTSGPVPGESSIYSDYDGKASPFPAYLKAPIPALTSGPPGLDDLLFQNLLSAEWVIFSFYQAGVEAFNASSFTDAGYPNTTYSRLASIRDNEAGHLRIFQDQISPTSLKPGPCVYKFPFTSPKAFLALQVLIEVSSMAFLTGMVQESRTGSTSGALVAVAEVETRHNTWALIDIWKTDPFSGPADTVFPYANQILDMTNIFIVPGSCPAENPIYPNPTQHLPMMSFNASLPGFTGQPGSPIQFTYNNSTGGKVQPQFACGKDYYAVYFHGVDNISVPFDTKTATSTIPAAFEGKGVIIAVIADEEGAPTLESVVAGPLVLLEQPGVLTKELA
ncbi:MAG: hypothetical protein M1818_001684 [Claussenomyces sp. TS43310]|nr:MAG: hypothetical protein M1818_001684 [Claussenomyces sp. TS43310]